jgi:hypothetical protein
MRRDRKLHGDKRAGLKEKWGIVWNSLGYLDSVVRRDKMEG